MAWMCCPTLVLNRVAIFRCPPPFRSSGEREGHTVKQSGFATWFKRLVVFCGGAPPGCHWFFEVFVCEDGLWVECLSHCLQSAFCPPGTHSPTNADRLHTVKFEEGGGAFLNCGGSVLKWLRTESNHLWW